MKTLLLSLLLLAAAPALAQLPTFDRAVECGSGDGDYRWGPTQMAVDAQRNTYVVGTFSGTILLGNSVLSAIQTAPSRVFPSDIFVAKLNAAGRYVWAVQFDDNQAAVAASLTADAQGDVYVAGGFSSFSLRLGTGGPTLYNSSARVEGFIAKFNGQTGQCQWARRCGGTDFDALSTVRTNAAGEVYVLVDSYSAVADYGPFTLANAPSVIAKLSSTGTWLWARPVGTGSIGVGAMALDAQGDIYLAGAFSPPSATFGPTTLTTQQVAGAPSPSSTDVFVAKLTDTGVWRWAVQGDGTGQQNMGGAGSLILDSVGHVYVSGGYVGQAIQLGATRLPNNSLLVPQPNPLPAVPYTNNYFSDAFVARLNATTGAWEWATRNGGAYSDGVGQLVMLDSQHLYTLGYFNTTRLAGVYYPPKQLARLDASTGAWQQFTRLDSMQVLALLADRQGRLLLGGSFYQPTLTLGPVRLPQAGPGRGTGFIARIAATPLPTRPATAAGTGLQVWPNPTAGRTVQVQGLAAGQLVAVLDVLGRQVAQGQMPAAGPLGLTLPAQLPGGVYVVRGGGQVARLVVE